MQPTTYPRVMTGIGLAVAGYACFSVQDAIVADALQDRAAYEFLGRLCDDFGGRLTGSPANQAALVRTVEELASLRRRTQVPVAADESVRRAADPLEVVRRHAADVVVLKVQPLGGVRACLRLAEQLDLLLPNIDFLSIGTNDLTQFLFAADRANPKLAERYDWLSPSILRFVRRVVGPARAAGVPVAVCGEMGGRPLEAMALIGLGIDRLSITPAAVGPVKAMIRSLDHAALRGHMTELLARPPRDFRAALADWAGAQGVELA